MISGTWILFMMLWSGIFAGSFKGGVKLAEKISKRGRKENLDFQVQAEKE